MKIKSCILICIMSIFIFSCKNQADPKKDFLDFYIGMNAIQFNQIKDSLLNAGIIYENQGKYYYDFKTYADKIVPSLLSFKVEREELKEITITLGHKTYGIMPLNMKSYCYSNNEYFSECIEPMDAEAIYQIYHKKYGKPDEINSEGKYHWWKKSNHVDVRFSKGWKNEYTCDTTRYIMGAFILYAFDMAYEEQRESKKTQDNI